MDRDYPHRNPAFCIANLTDRLMFIFVVPFFIFPVIVLVNFYYQLADDSSFNHPVLLRITEIWTVLIAPFVFLSIFDWRQMNDCCTDSAVFAPDNRIGIYLLIFLCIAAYFYSSFRSKLTTPVIELLVSSALVSGVILNILISIHINKTGTGLWLLGNVPVIMLFLIAMKRNKELLDHAMQEESANPHSRLAAWSLTILKLKVWIQFPVLALIAVPLLLLITLVLFTFGQKPDTFIRAFTDTYKHGFSQLDYMCDNVQCGGHFLCSVAANGHKRVVQPQRYGERKGHKIICNRQLLVANAFEELIQARLPFIHRQVRKQYNRVGSFIHRYYTIFNNKFVADVVYFVMKPLEWFFLLTLYTLDIKPEDRIARQYLSKSDRAKLQECKSTQEAL